MSELLRLSGPSLPRVVCPLCNGRRAHAISLIPRPCICCRGTGLYVGDRYTDPSDARAFELNLHPRPA
jgi:predicted nucleic acid-binding Zn ribbon protein